MKIATLVGCVLFLCGGSAIASRSHHQVKTLHRLQDLSQHVGEFPCTNGMLQTRAMQSALHKTLGSDYNSYIDFMTQCGCGQIESHGPYLMMDVSQDHVGGYTSLILVRKSDAVMFLLWLKSGVGENDLEVYGPKPRPRPVIDLFAHAMNVAWGHVACFVPAGNTVKIDFSRYADSDTGKCQKADPLKSLLKLHRQAFRTRS